MPSQTFTDMGKRITIISVVILVAIRLVLRIVITMVGIEMWVSLSGL